MPGRPSRNNTEESLDNLGDAINECVRYILCREGSKIPIKRVDIIKFLNSTCQVSTNQVNSIIRESETILKQIYGYKLVQVDSKSGIQYIVVLVEPSEGSLLSSTIDPHQRQLLVAALTHILMSRAPVKEDDMWSFLAETGLLEENNFSGRKILTHLFTRQQYLKYSKVGEGDLARNLFEWGRRAIEEVPKIFLLNKVAQALGKEPTYWSEHYKDCTTEQE
ncbi:non-structural maintenance of chromosomes element 3 homolog [Zerene cesonia]|uniref:non-structural maintenance of chromosomes element 3 homolog n=1 Tax=Zerene cesonia TaxID=33412 RepID=UPI0018E585A7|nr:non-structural maintenance of chromosomes element 3 homolog [Zerene cesonia]